MEKQEHEKVTKLKEYLLQNEMTRIKLWELFMYDKVLTEQEYHRALLGTDQAYRKFLQDLHKKPLNEDKVLENNWEIDG